MAGSKLWAPSGPMVMSPEQVAQVQWELSLSDYSVKARASSPEYAPTFIIMHEEMGGGFSDLGLVSYAITDDGLMVVGTISQVFAPRITNISEIRIWVRKPNTPPVLLPHATRYPNMKADCMGLLRRGSELVIFAGTHTTEIPPDGNGRRRIALEKDAIPFSF